MCCTFNQELPYDFNLDYAVESVTESYAKNSVYAAPLNFDSVRENLAHSKEQWLGYMSRYMRRSAAEARYYCNKYLSNRAVKEMFVSSDKTIRILSVMCGNGGDAFGALTAVIEMLEASSLSSYPDIEVTAIDGSNYALEQFKKLFAAWNKRVQADTLKSKSCNITLKTVEFVFDPATEDTINYSFSFLYEIVRSKKYDIITSFKGIGEIIQSHIRTAMPDLRYKNFYRGFCNHAYARFLDVFADVLSDRGAVIIADSSNMLEGNIRVMTNYLLVHQVFNCLNYNREDNNIHLIYPRPCACMTEGKGREENCPLSRIVRNDSYGSSCLIQERGSAVSRYNRESAECFSGMILCHEKAYSALNGELLEKDSTDINFKLVGQQKSGLQTYCAAL